MPVSLQLVAHGLVILTGMLARAIDEMQQHATALDVTEEAVAEADTLVRILNESRQVGEDELALVDAHDSELRMQRGERIVSNLGLRGADCCEKGRLAGVRQSDEPGIRDQLEAKPDGALCAGQSGIGVAWRLVP